MCCIFCFSVCYGSCTEWDTLTHKWNSLMNEIIQNCEPEQLYDATVSNNALTEEWKCLLDGIVAKQQQEQRCVVSVMPKIRAKRKQRSTGIEKKYKRKYKTREQVLFGSRITKKCFECRVARRKCDGIPHISACTVCLKSPFKQCFYDTRFV